MSETNLLRRFFKTNPDTMTDEELIQLLLSFSSEEPERLAHALMEQYPTIAMLMEADAAGLRTVSEMDESSVLLLQLVPELHRRYFLSRTHSNRRLKSSEDLGAYLLPYFYGAREELVYLLLLDGVGKVLDCRLISRGSLNSASVPMRVLVQEALALNASGLVLAHNHPAGIAVPSRQDVEFTLQLRKMLDVLNILLLDHIIVGEDDFVSLRDSGYLAEF